MTIDVIVHDAPTDVRVGVDVVAAGRVQAAVARHGEAFAATIFQPGERATLEVRAGGYERSFAAKEAFAKALGVGVVAGVELTDIDATDPDDGIVLSGRLALGLGLVGRRWSARTLVGSDDAVVVVWVGTES